MEIIGNKQDTELVCSRTTAYRLAGMFSIIGADKLEETDKGLIVSQEGSSRLNIKFSPDNKDTVEAVMLYNKLMGTGTINLALTSFLECYAIMKSESSVATLKEMDIERAEYVKKFYCRIMHLVPGVTSVGKIIEEWQAKYGLS